VPEQLTEDEFNALLEELDSFKLAIRGYAAIEAQIDASIASVFPSEVPDEVLRLPARTRLALGAALGVMPSNFRDGIGRLAKLRHDFAHGKAHELTRSRARSLWAGFRPHLPQATQDRYGPLLEVQPPIETLRIALIVARLVIRLEAEATQRRRAEEQRIVGTHSALQARLRDLERRPYLEAQPMPPFGDVGARQRIPGYGEP
jgi:hypothetical protein